MQHAETDSKLLEEKNCKPLGYSNRFILLRELIRLIMQFFATFVNRDILFIFFTYPFLILQAHLPHHWIVELENLIVRMFLLNSSHRFEFLVFFSDWLSYHIQNDWKSILDLCSFHSLDISDHMQLPLLWKNHFYFTLESIVSNCAWKSGVYN